MINGGQETVQLQGGCAPEHCLVGAKPEVKEMFWIGLLEVRFVVPVKERCTERHQLHQHHA